MHDYDHIHLVLLTPQRATSLPISPNFVIAFLKNLKSTFIIQ